ncbi:ABC transporter substrate-binding protein [Trujillonella endophytica]|uniref:Amino acid/amide ABC transporter substrate-binding protein, HAAT family n=1 Tax=Trujillonella endophytica TaxID=673521 RepID=A0A1H8UNT9_9ACTN|nr:ABC transporter substrate-binding protein [Trujillella endophytica]SEP04872.1 amino acid/amide ABC transporter substrate-binding protein, HAAT family [Trujillella endophytica]
MRTRRLTAIAGTAALLIAMAACGSDDEEGGDESSSGGGGGGSQTVKVGILTPLSGPAAATYGDAARTGVEARLAAYAEEGGECADVEFEVVEADTVDPAGALTSAQRLVQQEEVYAILSTSPFVYGASAYLTTQASDVPVLGDASDQDPGWRALDNNMFQAQPIPDAGAAYTVIGDYFDTIGGTKIAGASFPVASSSGALDAAAVSAEEAGLDVGYLNTEVPFGSTDVGAIVLGIRDSGADVLYLPITFDTALAIVEGLRQNDVELAGILAATGYGNDLLESEPAVAAAQGVSFSIAYAPVSLGTESTERLANAVREQGIESGIPTYGMVSGWFNADLLIYGLEQAGCDASQTDFIAAVNESDSYDGSGLFPAPIDYTTTEADELCQYFVTLEGEEFVAVEGAAPLCGTRIE